MKTRIIKTKIWSDSKFLELSPNARLVLLFLLTSPYVGMTNFIECADIFIVASTGVKELPKIKAELESTKIAFFHDGWIIIPNLEKHNNYNNSPSNEKVYNNEISAVPQSILEYFNTSMDTSVDGTVYSNHKSKTINNKSKIINQKPKTVEISQEKKQEIAERYQVPLAFVESKYDDLLNYCQAKGKTYSDYGAALANWVKRDALQVVEKFNDKKRYTDKYKVTKAY